MIRFHLAAFFINLALIILVVYIFEYLLYLAEVHYLETRSSLMNLYLYYALIFSWLSTFSIYIIRHAKRHFYYFFCSSIAVFLLLQYFAHMESLNLNAASFEWNNFYLNLVDAMLEAITPITVISLAVHFSQMILGKWLLPQRYGRRPGGGAEGMAA